MLTAAIVPGDDPAHPRTAHRFVWTASTRPAQSDLLHLGDPHPDALRFLLTPEAQVAEVGITAASLGKAVEQVKAWNAALTAGHNDHYGD
jgi:hypothetical protein